MKKVMKKSVSILSLIMGRFLFFLFAICIYQSSNAQKNSVYDSLTLKRIYKANIFIYNSKGYFKGYLANLSDSELQLSSSPVYFRSSNTKNNFSAAYNYDQLKKVIIQRKGAIGRGAGYGALIGLVAGVATGVIGSESENDNSFQILSRGAITAFTGILGAASGALIGIIVGALAHNTFIIDGNKNKFDSMRKSIFNNLLHHHSGMENYSTPQAPQL